MNSSRKLVEFLQFSTNLFKMNNLFELIQQRSERKGSTYKKDREVKNEKCLFKERLLQITFNISKMAVFVIR